jgi:hypothetical protein
VLFSSLGLTDVVDEVKVQTFRQTNYLLRHLLPRFLRLQCHSQRL